MALEGKIPVKLHLETQIKQFDQEEKHVFDEDGELIQMGQTFYLRYQEHQNHEQTAVTFKLGIDGNVQLTRGGDTDEAQLRLRFKQGESLGSIYQTRYGRLPVLTTTSHLLVSLKEQPISGEVLVTYQLDINDQPVGDYNLRLIFTA